MAEPKPSLFVAPDRVIFVATRQTPWASGRKTYTTPGPYAFPGWPTYTSRPLTASTDPKAPCAVSVAGAIPNATASENRWRDVISGALRRVRGGEWPLIADRKSTRLNSSHGYISYAVFCLKKKKNKNSNYEIWTEYGHRPTR